MLAWQKTLKDLKFLLFCKIDEVICLVIAQTLRVNIFEKQQSCPNFAHTHIHKQLGPPTSGRPVGVDKDTPTCGKDGKEGEMAGMDWSKSSLSGQ